MAPSIAGGEALDDSGLIATDVKVRTRGGLEIEYGNGYFSLALGGRIALEAAIYKEDNNDPGNGTAMDAARIGLDGRVFRHWTTWTFLNQ